MTISELIRKLHSELQDKLPEFTILLEDGTIRDQLHDSLETKGVVITVSKFADRDPISENSGSFIREVKVPIVVRTNSSVEGAPDFNDVIDKIEIVVCDISARAIQHKWEFVEMKSLEDPESTQCGYIILSHTYTKRGVV
jgi:hypothetical protein